MFYILRILSTFVFIADALEIFSKFSLENLLNIFKFLVGEREEYGIYYNLIKFVS